MMLAPAEVDKNTRNVVARQDNRRYRTNQKRAKPNILLTIGDLSDH